MVLFLCQKMKELFKLFYLCEGGVCTDTRNIVENSLFISLKGSSFNGNEYALKAIESGAKYAIVDEIKYVNNTNIFLVEDGLLFLQKLANYHRQEFNIPIIGITGSNGKTSTKELVYCVLKEKYNVLATKGNLNNHIGVPLTLLQLNSKHEIGIIEMGANKPLDIHELCEIAEPTHGIITNIGKAHLEGFKTFEGVIKTKTELYQSVAAKKGILVVNSEDDTLMDKIPLTIENFKYSTNNSGNLKGNLIKLSPFIEMTWEHENYKSKLLQTNMIGKYNFYNFLAAISFGLIFKIENELINKAITSYIPTNNRSQIQKTKNNTLILDCYNANPTSMLSSIDSFALIDHDSKLAIVGDMLELGEESSIEHQNIINHLNNLNIKYYTVGPLFNSTIDNKALFKFSATEELHYYLEKNSINNKLILLKGSRGIGLEKLEHVL
jgi:UDP-N-acetylmuramoyl-tripeptide--D-alanyl-D-alanine ligase